MALEDMSLIGFRDELAREGYSVENTAPHGSPLINVMRTGFRISNGDSVYSPELASYFHPQNSFYVSLREDPLIVDEQVKLCKVFAKKGIPFKFDSHYAKSSLSQEFNKVLEKISHLDEAEKEIEDILGEC